MAINYADVLPRGGVYSDNDEIGPSPRVWKKYRDFVAQNDDGGQGFHYYDDFTNAGGPVATNVGSWGGYKTFEDTSGSILPSTAFPRSLVFTTPATDNVEYNIQGSYSVGTEVRVSTSTPKAVIFEASFTTGQISNTRNWFCGLAAPGLAANDGLYVDAATFADVSYIGFHSGEAVGNNLAFVYNLAGQTDVVKIAALTTLVAATYVKVGFVYDPDAEDSKKITVYLNGAPQTTYVTATNLATSTGSAFPTGIGMSRFASLKTGEAQIKTANLRWWRTWMAA